MKIKTAVVIGATGATGRPLVNQLLDHPDYCAVVVLARKPLGIEHPKLIAHVVNFDQPDSWKGLVKGDELFAAMGTTLKQAGSKQAQYKVDYGYQLNAAMAAKQNGVAKILLVSSPNANAKSGSFYLCMKGKLDDQIRALEFDQCVLIKPSIIESERPEGRPGEKIAGLLLNNACKWVPMLRKYRPISGEQLATAMIAIAQSPLDQNPAEVELDALFDYL